MNNSLIEKEQKYFLQTYKRLPIVVDHAKGCSIYDKNGTRFLDFLGGIAVNALGHGHPKVIEAAKQQLERYMHLSNYFYQDAQIAFAVKLIQMSGFDRVFLSNSGTEAVEGAIKIVRRWGNLHGKTEIVGFTGGFHGRTYGALSIMDKPLYKDNMGPFLANMSVIPYNDCDGLEQNINAKTAGVILETLQGEGGVTAAKQCFIDKLFELKEKYNFLIIADEIQSGVGRTGKFFCFEHYGAKPDIATLAKGIGGGLPLGAILVRESLLDILGKGMHGTTYGGNAVACATGQVVLEELENGLMEHVTQTGNYLSEKLLFIKNKFPEKVLEVRGIGLMQGLLLSFDADILVKALLERHIITNAASGKVLRLVPPLIIGKAEIDELIEGLEECLMNI
jgi:acetylornithine/N-succinyldiaminopimelate aminotransferase